MPARNQIEARVIQIVDRVVGGGRAEDYLVECKADWPKAEEVRRQLAGHCNAARGEPVLWIIGLDEGGHSVRPLADVDLASWWSEVESRFAGEVTPDLTDVVVDTPHGTVVALHLETDRSPYLVSAKQGSGVEREVPWRVGTRTRSAHRHEVLSMLLPAVHTPEISLLGAECRATFRDKPEESLYAEDETLPVGLTLRVQAKIFFTASAPVMFPGHSWRMTLTGIRGRAEPVQLPDMSFYRGMTSLGRPDQPPYGVAIHSSGLYVSGPDVVHLVADGTLPIVHLAGPSWLFGF